VDRTAVAQIVREELDRSALAQAVRRPARAHRVTDKDAGIFGLAGSWINYGSYDVAGWVKQGGIVKLFGLITKTVATVLPNDQILQLPVEIRPPLVAGGHMCVGYGELGVARIDVLSAGQVMLQAGGTAGGGGALGVRYLTLNAVWWPIG
jgi:hypothetical protein